MECEATRQAKLGSLIISHASTRYDGKIECLPGALGDEPVLVRLLSPDFQRRGLSAEIFEHPCVMSDYGTMWHNKHQYVVLPRLDPSFRLLDQMNDMILQLDWDARLHLLTQIAEVVYWLHSHGCIHGNLSASSIWWDGNNIKIWGFGEYRVRGADWPSNMQMLDESSWQAPEILLDNGKCLSERNSMLANHDIAQGVDVFSFGNTIIYMMIGQTPRIRTPLYDYEFTDTYEKNIRGRCEGARNAPESWWQLARDCMCSLGVKKRPTFAQILERLSSLRSD